jgi:hypothetical protein
MLLDTPNGPIDEIPLYSADGKFLDYFHIDDIRKLISAGKARGGDHKAHLIKDECVVDNRGPSEHSNSRVLTHNEHYESGNVLTVLRKWRPGVGWITWHPRETFRRSKVAPIRKFRPVRPPLALPIAA